MLFIANSTLMWFNQVRRFIDIDQVHAHVPLGQGIHVRECMPADQQIVLEVGFITRHIENSVAQSTRAPAMLSPLLEVWEGLRLYQVLVPCVGEPYGDNRLVPGRYPGRTYRTYGPARVGSRV